MPMPPLLDTINWNQVYDSGETFSDWLNAADEKKRLRIQEQMDALEMPPDAVESLNALSKPVHIVAIAEDWCGDVVRHVPVLERLADACENVHVRYVTREANKDVFVRYLTNGGEAIPKFIFLSDAFVECGNWGPMPQRYKDLIARGKACGDVAAARAIIAQAYGCDDDRAHTINELIWFIGVAGATSVE